MYRYFILFGLVSCLTAGFALAESYSAMDPKAAQQEQEAPNMAPEANAEPPRLVPARYVRERFDLVQKEHIDQLEKRMKITAEILKKHERAYDYRQLSLKELKEILIKLDSDKKAEKFRGLPRSRS